MSRLCNSCQIPIGLKNVGEYNTSLFFNMIKALASHFRGAFIIKLITTLN